MRRWRAPVALAALLCALTACGGSGGSGSSSGDSTYTLGVLNSLTGSLGAVGQQEQKGMNLAVKQINAAGGVGGHQLALKFVDDQGSVNQSTAAFKQLATADTVPVILGPGISAPAKAVAPLADQYGVTNILLVAQAVVANGTKNVFEIPPTGDANAQAMVGYAAEQGGAKTAALIFANNPYGEEGNTDISAAAQKAGIRMVGSEPWDPAAFDFTAQATKVAGLAPDVVFLYGSGGTSDAQLLKAVRDAGYRGKIVGDLTYSPTGIPGRAGAAADSVVALTAVNFGHPSDEEKSFLDAYQGEYHETATVLAAYAYVAVKLAAAGLEKAGKADGRAVAAAIQSLDYKSLIGTLAYTSSADVFKPVSFKGSEFALPVF